MRKQIENIIIICAAALCLWSVLAVLTTTMNTPGLSSLYIKQMTAIAIGWVMLVFFRVFSYKILQELSPLIFFTAIALLIAVFAVGTEVHGGRRWLDLGVVYFQPVEFAKVAVILYLSYLLEKRDSFLRALIPVGAVIALVVAQPDVGSILPLIPVFAAILVVSRVDTSWMAAASAIAATAGISLLLESYMNANGLTVIRPLILIYPLLATVIAVLVFREARQLNRMLRWSYLAAVLLLLWGSAGAGIAGAHSLKAYQRRRVVPFLMPEIDPLGAGYNTRQSILAVGSGKLFGKGLFGGTQTQLGFLPVRHTDFILASVGEETGFAGVTILLSVFFLLLWQFTRIIERTDDYGGLIIATGIFILFLTQAALNIGVTLGMLPVMGVPFPLISYGGTGMVIFLSLTGVMLNINRRTELIGV